MTRAFPLVFAVIATCLAPGRSSADPATITADTASSPAQGQISARGSYTIMAGTRCWRSISMQSLMKGGQKVKQSVRAPQKS